MNCELYNNNTCFNGGTCNYNSYEGAPTCGCLYRYDPTTFCNTTFVEALHGEDVVMIAVYLSIFILLSAAYCFELVSDLRQDGIKRVKNSKTIAKITILIFLLIQYIYYGFWMRESVSGETTPDAQQSILELLLLISALIVGFGYIFVTISWMEILLKAKKIGIASKSLKRIRLSLYIMIIIIAPTTLLIQLLTLSNLSFVGQLSIVGISLAGLSQLMVMGLVTVLLVRTWCWLRSMTNSPLISMIRYRNLFIALSNLVLLLFVVYQIYSLIVPTIDAVHFLVKRIVSLTLQCFSLIFIFMFLESHTMHHLVKREDPPTNVSLETTRNTNTTPSDDAPK